MIRSLHSASHMQKGSVHINFDKWSTSRINASVRSCCIITKSFYSISKLPPSNDPEGLASKGISSVLDFSFNTLRSFSCSISGLKTKIGKQSTCVTSSSPVRSGNNLPSQCRAKEPPLSSTLWKKEFLKEALMVHELSILARRTELLKNRRFTESCFTGIRNMNYSE